MNAVPERSLWCRKAEQLLQMFEQLLKINDVEVSTVLNQAAQQIAEILCAEKVEVFIYDRESHTLVALGTSDLSTFRNQQVCELHELPLTKCGRIVFSFLEGKSSVTDQVNKTQEEIKDINALKERGVVGEIESEIIVPLEVNGERCGVLIAVCKNSDGLSEHDLLILEEIARLVGLLLQRAELVRQLSQEIAQQTRRAVAEEMLAILAHDLCNYLTPLKTRLELVERRARREDREQDRRDLGLALSSLDRFSRLIFDLLDSTRLKQGVFSIKPSILNLVDLIQETVPAFQTQKIPIHLQTQAEVLMVSADPDRLKQVLENLLSNAMTHAPEQTPVLVTIQSQKQQNSNWAQVIVSNQGPSIPLELQAQLFEPFVAGSTSGGLGLGLYIAASIAQAHQGHLSVTSLPDEGTAFILSIPLWTNTES